VRLLTRKAVTSGTSSVTFLFMCNFLRNNGAARCTNFCRHSKCQFLRNWEEKRKSPPFRVGSSRPRTATTTTLRGRELLPRPLLAVANCHRDHSSRPRTDTAVTPRGRELTPQSLLAAANCYRDHSSRPRTATATTLRGRELIPRTCGS
jgi:hypothetical protein